MYADSPHRRWIQQGCPCHDLPTPVHMLFQFREYFQSQLVNKHAIHL